MKLNIYKASAGSGKTHILAGNYITESFNQVAPARSGSILYEAFRDTMAFARILAVTFTNKAAGEMKERIIKELDKLAAGGKATTKRTSSAATRNIRPNKCRNAHAKYAAQYSTIIPTSTSAPSTRLCRAS